MNAYQKDFLPVLNYESQLTVRNGIVSGPESILQSVLDLCDGVLVGALDQNGHRLRLLAVLHERVFFLSLQFISSFFSRHSDFISSPECVHRRCQPSPALRESNRPQN